MCVLFHIYSTPVHTHTSPEEYCVYHWFKFTSFPFSLHLTSFTITICLITQHSSKWLSFLFMIDLLWMMKANVGHWSRADELGTLKMAAILFYFLFNFSSVSFIFHFFIYMSVILAELKEWWPFWNDSQQRKIC